MLDGARVWGSVEIRAGRFGLTHYRLVVYPPGLTAAERRRIRLARGWPLWGTLLWVVCEIWLTGMMSAWPALGLSAAVLLGAGAVAFAAAGSARARVHMLLTTTMAGYDDRATQAACDSLVRLATALLEADDRLSRGEISIVDHELVWWRVYDALDDGTTTPAGRAP